MTKRLRGAARVIGWLLLATALLYAGALSLLYYNQRLLLFPAPTGPRAHPDPDPGYREIFFTSTDGTRVRAFYHVAAAGRPTVLFYHGNAGSLVGSERMMAPFIAAGMGALLPEYRGYGGNPGSPSETGFVADGLVAREWLARAGVPGERTILFGYSLGTGVAAALAAEARPAALVLVAPYSSIPHVARQHYPFVPTDWLIRDRFDTLERLPHVKSPILIVHGTDDATVPIDNGEALAAAVPSATFMRVPGADHTVIHDEPIRVEILRWLEGKMAS